MDEILVYALAKKMAKSSASGVSNIYKEDNNLVFEMADGQKIEINLSDLVSDNGVGISNIVIEGYNLKIYLNNNTIKSVDLSRFLDGRDFKKDPINLKTETIGKISSDKVDETIAKTSDLHTHTNKGVIDFIQENSDGVLTYKGIAVGGVAGIANININGNDLNFIMQDGSNFTVSLNNVAIQNGNVEKIEYINDSIKITYSDLTIQSIDLSKYLDSRDFTINPIDLQREITGVLHESNISNDIARKTDLHTHDNDNVLSQIGENTGGRLTYKGSIIDGKDGKNLEFIWKGTSLGIRVEGDTEYQYIELKGRDGIDGINGINGRDGIDGVPIEVAIRNNEIQWRYIGQPEEIGWNTIISIQELRADIETLKWSEF